MVHKVLQHLKVTGATQVLRTASVHVLNETDRHAAGDMMLVDFMSLIVGYPHQQPVSNSNTAWKALKKRIFTWSCLDAADIHC